MTSTASPLRTTRAGFLRALGAGAAALGLPGLARATAPTASRPLEPGRARNVIVMISDGMSLGALSLAEQFRRRRDGRGTAWLGLYADPGVRRALMETCSADALVTDSAAAGSAFGGGLRVPNRSLNVGSAGERPTPLLVAARASGRATGLVTTSAITHATPASFAVNHPDRNEEEAIASLYLGTGIDVFLGGGAKFFDPAKRADGRDLFAEMRGRGYAVARSRSDLEALPADGGLFGAFADGHQPYALDHAGSPELEAAHPTLAAMTELALGRLAARGGDRGFVLQVEGARIDHAAHANDFGALVHDQLAFDDALAAVRAFAADRDDTLVVVTTDHGNANPGLLGSDAAFARSFRLRRTNTAILADLGPDTPVAALRDAVQAGTGVALTDEEGGHLRAALRGEYRAAYRAMQGAPIVLGQLLANHHGIGWNGAGHTSDLVEVAAWGPGSESLAPLLRNVDLHALFVRAAGLAG